MSAIAESKTEMHLVLLRTARVGLQRLIDSGIVGEASTDVHLVEMKAGEMVLEFEALCLAANHYNTDRQAVSYPCDWWEAFKQRWAPAWVLERWPVQLRTVVLETRSASRVCPHYGVRRQREHLLWLMDRDGKVRAGELELPEEVSPR